MKVALLQLKEEVARYINAEPGSSSLAELRAAITKVVGSDFKCGRTLQYHLEELVTDIRSTYKDDTLKQIQ